jgi:hypothetical protein
MPGMKNADNVFIMNGLINTKEIANCSFRENNSHFEKKNL